MPRKPRVDVPGTVYHITARGNHQQRIFYTPKDYHVYLRLLREATQRFGLRVLAYALLPNHVHLLCRRGPVALAKVMHDVQRRFALHHNRQLGLRGHVFQDRYHAKLCREEGYLWAAVRYIHNNPVQAGLCDHPGDYPWTSYHAYA
ncbi:MAG: transposase, partial [candidate division GAL15 bacterium]